MNRNKFKTLTALMLLLVGISTTLLAGCWDYLEIDETGIILALGIDKGKENKLSLTARIAVPRVFTGGASPESSGGSNGKRPVEVVTVEAPTFTGALNMMNTFISLRLSLKHVKTVVFSEEIAREGIMTYLAVMARYPEFRRSVFITVCRNVTAREYLNSNFPVFESNPAKDAELLRLSSTYTNLIPAEPYFHFFYNDAKGYDADPTCHLISLQRDLPPGEGPQIQGEEWRSEGRYYPGELPRQGGNPRELLGTAVFRGDRLVGEINGDETTALKLVRNTFKRAEISFEDPQNPGKMVALKLHRRKAPTFEIDLSGPVPRVHITVYLEGALIGVQASGINYEEPYNRLILEKAASDYLKKTIDKLIFRSQNAFRADILHVGKYVKHHFPTVQAWRDYRWLEERFPVAEITSEVQINIRTFGLKRKNEPLPRQEVKNAIMPQ